MTSSTQIREQFQQLSPLRVLVESPFKASTKQQLNRNLRYARACIRDSVLRGEVPWCSHLFYTQDGILDDRIEEERACGINLGLIWGQLAQVSAVYVDLGISAGMRMGIDDAGNSRRRIVYRGLPFDELARLKITPVAAEDFLAELTVSSIDRLPVWPAL